MFFQDDAGWDREKAKKMFEAFLKLNVSYDCIISNNDEMALGVIDAMEENGIDPSKVPILGLDATPEACKAISNGKNVLFYKTIWRRSGRKCN